MDVIDKVNFVSFIFFIDRTNEYEKLDLNNLESVKDFCGFDDKITPIDTYQDLSQAKILSSFDSGKIIFPVSVVDWNFDRNACDICHQHNGIAFFQTNLFSHVNESSFIASDGVGLETIVRYNWNTKHKKFHDLFIETELNNVVSAIVSDDD